MSEPDFTPLRQPLPDRDAFHAAVTARIQQRKRSASLWLLAPALAALAVFVLWRGDDFIARGGQATRVRVELVKIEDGFGVRVKNQLDRPIRVGAYVIHKDGETTWVAPHWPEGVATRPALIEVPAGTELKLLDEGVKPDAPAVSLTGFAEDLDGKRIYEHTVEAP